MAAILRITIPSRLSCRHSFENLFLLLICIWPPFCKLSFPSDYHVDMDLRIHSCFSSVHGRHFVNHHPLQTIMCIALRIYSYFSSVQYGRLDIDLRIYSYILCTWPPFRESPSPADHHVDIALRIYSYFSSVQGRHFENHHPLNTIM
jgi:hypothetical protein